MKTIRYLCAYTATHTHICSKSTIINIITIMRDQMMMRSTHTHTIVRAPRAHKAPEQHTTEQLADNPWKQSISLYGSSIPFHHSLPRRERSTTRSTRSFGALVQNLRQWHRNIESNIIDKLRCARAHRSMRGERVRSRAVVANQHNSESTCAVCRQIDNYATHYSAIAQLMGTCGI